MPVSHVGYKTYKISKLLNLLPDVASILKTTLHKRTLSVRALINLQNRAGFSSQNPHVGFTELIIYGPKVSWVEPAQTYCVLALAWCRALACEFY